MATSDTKPGKSRKGKPITENPLFPAVVALWFGALFGLGSLAIRVGLLEQLVLSSKIDTLIPAAAPPFGVTARIFLALALAVFGALLGAWIARKIAAPKPVVRERKRGATPAAASAKVEFRARDSHPDAPARVPISAHEELGGANRTTAAGDLGVLAGRRRSSLAIEHDETFELHETAPLPGGAWQIHAPHAAEDEALELGEYADGPDEENQFGQFEPPPPAPAPALDWQASSAPEPARQMFQPLPSAIEAEVHAEAEPAALDFTPPADAMEGRQVFGMTQPQPDEVLDQLGITDAEFEDLAPVTIPTESLSDFAQPAAAPVVPEAAPESSAKLGMDQLAAKLASSMQRRRERLAAANTAASQPAVEAELPVAPAEPVLAASAPAEFPGAPFAPTADFLHPNDIPAPVLPPLPVAEAAPSMPPIFAASSPVVPTSFGEPAIASDDVPATPRLPAALRPIALDVGIDDEDEDPVASFLPPRSIAMPAPPPAPVEPRPMAGPAEDAGDEAEAETAYSSLLNLSQPAAARSDFVRIEEPEDECLAIEPVVIFPGQAARFAPTAVPAASGFVPDEEDTAGFRRFDAPDSAESGQSIAGAPAPAQNAEETERALRAALANLQRMSGAA